MNLKKITSLTMLLAMFIMTYTGIMLFIAPPGRIANWANWEILALSKEQYASIHTMFMVLFVIATILHIYYNWKPILSYLRDSTKKISFTKKEFLIAFLLNLFFVVGTLIHIQPLQGFLDVGESIKESWGENKTTISKTNKKVAIKAPPERLGKRTLQELSDMGNIDLEYALEVLKLKGIEDITSDTKIKDIAGELYIEKTDVYKLITE